MIILPEEINQIISEITKKYGIEETKEDAIKRFRQSKFPKSVFIAKISKYYFQKNLPDSDLVSSLKENLEISEEIAKKISIDIREKIIPKIKIVDSKENNENLPLEAKKIESVTETIPPPKMGVKNIQQKESYPLPKKLLPKKQIKIEDLKVKRATDKKNQDTYREPID